MNELKIYIDELSAFEDRLRDLGGRMQPPCWFGNWYLETTPSRILKVMQVNGQYSLLELKKLDAGFSFVSEKPITDIATFGLDRVPPKNVLHKTVNAWLVNGQSIDVLVFDNIGIFACVNYEDGQRATALAFIDSLKLHNPRYLEVPFNVLKRRQLGLPDYD